MKRHTKRKKSKRPANRVVNVSATHPEDWKKLKKSIVYIENHSFEKEARFDDTDYDSFLNRNSINFIAKNRRGVVGYLMSSRLKDSYGYKNKKGINPHILRLESIAVLPEYRGKKIGKKLFMRFLTAAKRRGFKRIVLDATSRRMEKLAENFGFYKIKKYESWIGDRSSWLMERKF